MPLYEYTCAACAADFEQLVRSVEEQRELRCPACGGKRVTRKLSTFAARSAAPARDLPLPRGGGACGRCGDPNGPCGSGF